MDTVFLSRSGAKSADNFVEVVEQQLREHGFSEFTTIGRNTSEDDSLINSVMDNIKAKDIFVTCITKDMPISSAQSIGIEFSLAKYTYNKPVMVFVENGVDVSALIKVSTQYIEFDGSYESLCKKEESIKSLVESCGKHDQRNEEKATIEGLSVEIGELKKSLSWQ
jgi:hypothetical protein